MSKKQITGIVIAVAAIAIYFGVKMYASDIAEKKVKEAVAKASNFADIEYKKVTVDLFGLNAHISDILVSQKDNKKKTKIDEIIIYDIDSKSETPTFISLKFKGIHMDIKDFRLSKENLSGFRKLGYKDKMKVNLDIDYKYDKEKKDLDIKKLGLGIDDFGEINLSYSLGDIGSDQIAMLMFAPHKSTVTLKDAKIIYKDHSLADSLIKLAAEKEGKNIKDFKESMLKDIDKELDTKNDEFAKAAYKEIKKFINDPKEISISISPSNPETLGNIIRTRKAEKLIKMLNIKIKS